MARWKVREGYQVKHDGKHYVGGETFDATESQVASFGDLVSKVQEKAAQHKAQPAPKPSAKK